MSETNEVDWTGMFIPDHDCRGNNGEYCRGCEVILSIGPQCKDCWDWGELSIKAHQSAGEIIDEKIYPCHCRIKEKTYEND